MAARLDDAEIARRMGAAEGWARDGDAIRRSFSLDSFPAAIAFVTRVGFLAEAANHHPDIDIRWRTVTLMLSTHDAGGLTQRDFDLAAQVNQVAG